MPVATAVRAFVLARSGAGVRTARCEEAANSRRKSGVGMMTGSGVRAWAGVRWWIGIATPMGKQLR